MLHLIATILEEKAAIKFFQQLLTESASTVFIYFCHGMTVSPLQSLSEFKILPDFYYPLYVKVLLLFDVSPKDTEDISDVTKLPKKLHS